MKYPPEHHRLVPLSLRRSYGVQTVLYQMRDRLKLISPVSSLYLGNLEEAARVIYPYLEHEVQTTLKEMTDAGCCKLSRNTWLLLLSFQNDIHKFAGLLLGAIYHARYELARDSASRDFLFAEWDDYTRGDGPDS